MGCRGGGGGEGILFNINRHLFICTELLRKFPSSNIELLGIICPASYKWFTFKSLWAVCIYVLDKLQPIRSVLLFTVYQAAEDTWDTVMEPLINWDSADGVRDVCETMQTETVELFISSAAKDTT